jgi:hypothetical protein
MFLRLFSACFMLGILAWSPSAHAVTVDFKALPNLSGTPELTVGGITVSGSGNINVWPEGGLGIFGPEFNSGVDPGEYIVFFFGGSQVLNVDYSGMGPDSARSAWVLGIDNVWSQVGLDSGDGSGNSFPVSALPILGFKLVGVADSFTVGSVTYDLSTVPLPAALPLFGTGLLLMGLLGRRRRRKSTAAIRSPH